MTGLAAVLTCLGCFAVFLVLAVLGYAGIGVVAGLTMLYLVSVDDAYKRGRKAAEAERR